MTLLIVLVTVGISYMGFTNSSFFEKYKFSPYKIKLNKEYIRFVSGGFLHADTMHLFVNMLALYSTGEALSQIYGNINYVLFYISAIVIASIPDYLKHKNNPYYAAIGASGGVSAALFALLIFDPWSKILLFFIIPIPFILFAVLYLGYSYYMSKQNTDNVGHLAHLTGAIYGLIFSIIQSPSTFQGFLKSLF